MALSKIEVTFNSLPSADEVLGISILATAPISGILEVFKTLRTAPFQCTIGSDASNAAFRFAQAVELDFNATGLYNITRVDEVVTIEANTDGETFVEVENTTGGAVTTSITNEAATPALTIDSVTYSTASSSPCANVKVTVTTSELATAITSPVAVDPNAANPFIFDWVRGVTINIACETATLSVSNSYTLPDILSVANMTLTVVDTPSGATLTVTHTNVSGLTLQYQIDAGGWQSSPSFTGLAEDTYTLYVKDQLGCTISKNFAVSVFSPNITVTTPEIVLSKAMSIRYKEDVTWANCSNYKNEENTLSCEYNVRIPYRTYQQFQSCDLIPTQFKSNYATNVANVIKADGTKDSLTVVKKTNYLGKTDKRDATYYAYSATQTGIYFTSGNLYNYSTGVDTGDDYALNGLLPEWGVIGNYIYLDAIGWYEIVDIITDDDLDADVLVIDYVYGGAPAAIIVSSLYNLFNYEVYEFNVDMSTYADTTIQVEILLSDLTFTSVRKLSEKIKVQTRWADTMELYYWNPTNTDVFYSTGIKNRIRVPYETFYPNVDGDIDGLDTDTNSVLLNSQAYETNIVVFSPVSVAVMRQIVQALLHKELYLDGVKYRITEIPEIEPHGDSNLQTITATLKKSSQVFNSEYEGTATTADSETELTGLLGGATKYIKLS